MNIVCQPHVNVFCTFFYINQVTPPSVPLILKYMNILNLHKCLTRDAAVAVKVLKGPHSITLLFDSYQQTQVQQSMRFSHNMARANNEFGSLLHTFISEDGN